MSARIIAFAFGLVWGLLAASLPAAEVEVLAESAEVKIGDKIVATVKQGQRLRLLQIKGPWVAVSLGEGGQEQRGWVLADKVRRLVEPGLQSAPAPAAPDDFRIDADWLQVLPAPDNSTHYLFVRLKLVNETFEPAKLLLDDIRLLVDRAPLAALRPNPNAVAIAAPGRKGRSFGAGGGFGLPPRLGRLGGFEDFAEGELATSPNRASTPNREQSEAARTQLPSPLVPEGEEPFKAGDLLQDAELKPGDAVAGWMCFDLKPLDDTLQDPAALDRKSWLLEAKVGGRANEFDIKAGEIARLGAMSRPSQYDANVTVLEIAPHINALNVGNLFALLDALVDEEQRFVLVFKAGDWFIDDYAAAQWRAVDWPIDDYVVEWTIGGDDMEQPSERRTRKWQRQRRESDWAILVRRKWTDELGGPRFRVSQLGVGSEEEVTIFVLEERKAFGALLPFLKSQSAAARRAAAEALQVRSKDEDQEVVAKLISAASDSEASVRAAALASLGGQRGYENTELWPEDSRPAAAIRKGLHDSEASVRQAAVSSVETSWSGIEEQLFRLLDDESEEVRTAACGRLGELKSQAVIARLKQLQAGLDKQLAAAAISSLERMGELKPAEAALARLECGDPDRRDFDQLAEAKEPRAVPALLAMLGNGGPFSGRAARTLGELKATEAVEPLLKMLAESRFAQRRAGERLRWVIIMPDHIVALGKLGDPRAIEPIRNVLGRKTTGVPIRMACYEALLLLEVPGAYRELTDELDKAKDADKINNAFRLLAIYGGEKAIAAIEPYLDREENVQSAAAALTLASSPLAAKVMESRLRRADYRFGPQVLEAVSSNETWLKSQLGDTLLQKAAASANESTKAAATELINSLELNERRKQEPAGSRRLSYTARGRR